MPYVLGVQIREPEYWGSEGQTLVRSRSEIAGTSTTFTPSLVDHDDGNYTATYTPTAAGRHIWMGETSDGIPVTFDWDVLTAAQADPVTAVGLTSTRVAKLDNIGSIIVSYSSPVQDGEAIEVYQGDDHYAADGRGLPWTLTGFPSLSGATVTLTIVSRGVTPNVTATGSVANAGQATQTVTVDLTHTQTATLNPIGPTTYDLSAVLSSGRAVTMVRGDVNVIPDV